MNGSMNCDAVRRWLEDARAEEADAVRVGEHLEHCAACRAFAELAEEASVLSDVSGLPDEIQPPADLWQDIQTEINTRRDEGKVLSAPFSGGGLDRQQLLSVITAVAAVIFLAVVLRSDPMPPVQDTRLMGSGQTGSGSEAAAMEQECRGAMAELTAMATSDSGPEGVALQAQAREVERAIADTRRAIEAEGGDPRMLASLARLCRVRLQLTEQTQELARS